MTDYSYIGVGKVHMRVAGSAAALAFVAVGLLAAAGHRPR